MADLPENAEWPGGIYQIETTDPVVGGPPNLALGQGISNVQAQQLAQRTKFLRDALAAFTALDGATVGAGKTVWSSDGFLMVNPTSGAVAITGRDKVALESNGLVEFFAWYKAQIIGTASPAGAIMAFAMSSPATGWLECNGAAISRAAYPALFAAIGTTYGAGDGSNTFNLPDLRGEFLRGWDHGRGVDEGRGLGSSQLDALQDHKVDARHRIYAAAGSAAASTGLEIRDYLNGQTGIAGASIASHVLSFPLKDGRFAAETRPRNVAMTFCIKY